MESVGNWDGEVVLGNGAVEGVKRALEKLKAGSLLALRGLLVVCFQKIGRSDGGVVQALPVDVDGSGLGEHVEDPEGRSASGPDIAKDGLRFAIKDSYVGRVGKRRELLRRLAEGLIDGSAATCDEGNWLVFNKFTMDRESSYQSTSCCHQ